MRHHATLRYVDAIARHGSIRRAADALAITPSALNRRLLALEQELGTPLFERLARGVRLSAAGELFLHHARRQMADMGRVRATIEDMKGARRGHVAIAFDRSLSPIGLAELIAAHRAEHPGVSFAVLPCDRADAVAMLEDYSADLAELIAAHRAEHPGVSFAVLPCDRADAVAMLEDYSADLALVVAPDHATALSTLATLAMRLDAVVRAGHRLATLDAVRLHQLASYPLVLPPPGRSARFVLEVAAARRDVRLDPAVVADRDLSRTLLPGSDAVAVELRVASEPRPAAAKGDGTGGSDPREAVPAFATTPLHEADIPEVALHLGQLRDRALPVPAARFAETLRRRMDALSDEP